MRGGVEGLGLYVEKFRVEARAARVRSLGRVQGGLRLAAQNLDLQMQYPKS